MKKLILILLISMPLTGTAQDYLGEHHPSAIYLSHQPVDLGIGVRGDYYINGLGLYSSMSYGNWGLYRQYGLSNHVKLSTGVLVPLKDYNGGKFDVTAGINYHHSQYVAKDNYPLNPLILNSFSFELGLSIKLNHFAVSMRTDVLRWEPCVDFGFAF